MIFLSDGGDSYPANALKALTDDIKTRSSITEYWSVGFGTGSDNKLLAQMADAFKVFCKATVKTALNALELQNSFKQIAEVKCKRVWMNDWMIRWIDYYNYLKLN